MRKQIVALVLASLTCLACLVSCVDSAPSNTGQIDLKANSAIRPPKLGLCAGCHGENGKAILADYPNLSGQNQRYLASSLRAYKSGERKNSAMRAMVGTLTEAEIEELASYYANSVNQ